MYRMFMSVGAWGLPDTRPSWTEIVAPTMCRAADAIRTVTRSSKSLA